MPSTDNAHPAFALISAAGLALLVVVAKLPVTKLFNLDGLALASGALILFVASIVAAFAWRHMRASRRRRFFGLTAGLVAGTLVFVTADHVALFALGWVASGLILAGLIGHSQGWEEAEAVSRSTRRLFLSCDAALVAGLALLTARFGTASISEIAASAATAPVYSMTLCASLIAIAAVARCALPPFSNWLLASMTAPTPVSALMHAGLVNAGGIVLLRFSGLFEASDSARAALALIGIAGAVYGAAIMLVRPDVKRGLAGSTVSQMGFMILSCSLGAYAAALWHLVAHGLFKAWLFLGSGANARAPLTKLDNSAAARSAFLASFVTLATVTALVAAGLLDLRQGSFIPVTFAILTGFLTLTMMPAATRRLQDTVWLAALGTALLVLHGFGLSIAQVLIGSNGPALLPAAGHVAIAAFFLALLAWQFLIVPRRNGFPPALYVSLLNAGTHRL